MSMMMKFGLLAETVHAGEEMRKRHRNWTQQKEVILLNPFHSESCKQNQLLMKVRR